MEELENGGVMVCLNVKLHQWFVVPSQPKHCSGHEKARYQPSSKKVVPGSHQDLYNLDPNCQASNQGCWPRYKSAQTQSWNKACMEHVDAKRPGPRLLRSM